MKREEFLARVSAQLDRAGPRAALRRDLGSAQAVEVSREQLVQRFCSELERLGGAVQVHGRAAEIESALIEFARSSGARRLVSFGKRNFEHLGFENIWRELPVSAWERGDAGCAEKFRAAAAAADIGLSTAELGIAATGSLFFSSDPSRPRAVSLLPRSHVAILDARALVPDLAAALAALAQRGLPPSSALFVSGPSRTSDIENDLTLGVHGPAAVTVFLLHP